MKIFGITVAAGGNPELFDYGINSDGWISELYNQAKGDAGLIDTVNTTAGYNATEDSYGEGVVQTNQLYNSATPITSLLINEISDDAITTRGTVAISFDNGSSWSTTTNPIGGTVTSFTGTSDDAGTYKLKLKFTLGGAGYNVDGTHVWVTTGSLVAGRWYAAGCGTTAAALCFCGVNTWPTLLNTTEIWNGSIWTTTAACVGINMLFTGCGTTSAALNIGGTTDIGSTHKSTTEKWLGTSWVTTTSLTEGKSTTSSCGTTAAALCMGGNTGAYVDTTEKWLGTSWVTTGALTTVKYASGGCGTTAAALCFGGNSDAYMNITEIWSGSSWATTGALTVARNFYSVGCGTTTAALCMGGYSGANVNTTEIWNGSIWTTTTSLPKIVRGNGNDGTASNALSFGGSSGESGAIISDNNIWYGTAQKGFSVKIN